MKKLLLVGSVLAMSLGLLSGCSYKANDTYKVSNIVYPDCVPCTDVSPKPCTPCKR